ncbi:hypothetical protein ZIOFF_072312 [Zingiber officinale]|uniref:Conserved oligomeric Golgi complex subunit 8 n=1 Tax=Zingiber officinale TaxID=94328 RepID=A0A8J5ETW9_ZINOF|nr:hypothetical protein ZIOFF_072312 [Zingiber officinale]
MEVQMRSLSGRADGEEEEATTVSALRLLPFAGTAQQHYVSELLSFTLDRLHKVIPPPPSFNCGVRSGKDVVTLQEPELLRIDAERIRRQMQEVAVGNYRAFIAAADAVSFIKEQLSGFDKHLDSLITEIPNLTAGCTEFIESAQQILEERKFNQTLLAHHSTLLDLLEIPQLMDTCIRNGNYEEALDLEAFVSKLSKMHVELPVIQALEAEVRKTMQSMLSQLLQKLRSNIQLPECLRIVAHLRRIGAFTESELRLQFLRCRETWLSGILDDLDQRNVYEYLKGMVSCHRTHLFDVVNQYRAIFNNDKSGSEENYDGGLLFSWAMHQIRNHLSTLEAMLPKITEGGSLSNILDQCMYCAMGLGLVGLDFRGLLPPLFEGAVINLFSKNMSTAVKNFQIVLDSHRWVPLPSVGFASNGSMDESNDDVAPPSALMEHPPIAIFVNGVSAAMNELRPCAPVSLKYILAQEVVQGLQAVSDSLVRYNAMRVLRGNESTLFLSLCRAFVEVAFPYCATCFNRCYPNGASLIMEHRSMLDCLSLLFATPPVRGLKDSLVSKEAKQPVEAVAVAIMTDHEAPANGEKSETDNHAEEIGAEVESTKIQSDH